MKEKVKMARSRYRRACYMASNAAMERNGGPCFFTGAPSIARRVAKRTGVSIAAIIAAPQDPWDSYYAGRYYSGRDDRFNLEIVTCE